MNALELTPASHTESSPAPELFTLTAGGKDCPDCVLTCDDADSASDLLDALRLDGYDLFTLRVGDKLMTFWYRGVQLARAKVTDLA